MLALATPIDPRWELPASERAARRLREFLGFDDERAASEARRCILFRRDRIFHDLMLFQMSPRYVRDSAARIAIDDFDRVASPSDHGLLLVSLHYGLFSSLLLIGLAVAMSRRRGPPVTILVAPQVARGVGMVQQRIARLEKALRLPFRRFVHLLERGATGTASARCLHRVLANGGSVLIFPDERLLPPTRPGAIECTIGRGTVGFARGYSWLEKASGCRVASMVIRPDGDKQRLVFRAARSADEALACLVADTLTPDPAPWEGWLFPDHPESAPPC